jgi:hypothetical protein
MSLPGASRRCMRAAGAAVNYIARIADITSIIHIKINVRANLGKRRARHRSPGALTCAKLGRFVQGLVSAAQSLHKGQTGPALRRGAFFLAIVPAGADGRNSGYNAPRCAILLRRAPLPRRAIAPLKGE